MPPKAILPPEEFPQEVLFDLPEIRKRIPQRFEMEQLTAVTLIDAERMIGIGYKDLTDTEFWVRGHMPDFPLMPGVMMCEACAQLCSLYCRETGVSSGGIIGFAGMNDVRFRGMVKPGDRLWVAVHTQRHDPRKMIFEMQAFVAGKMVFSGEMIGMHLTTK